MENNDLLSLCRKQKAGDEVYSRRTVGIGLCQFTAING
jgi:hypothetical protein